MFNSFYKICGALLVVTSLSVLFWGELQATVPSQSELISVHGKMIGFDNRKLNLEIKLEGDSNKYIYPRWNGKMTELSNELSNHIGSYIELSVKLEGKDAKIFSIRIGSDFELSQDNFVKNRNDWIVSLRYLVLLVSVLGAFGYFVGDKLARLDDKL